MNFILALYLAWVVTGLLGYARLCIQSHKYAMVTYGRGIIDLGSRGTAIKNKTNVKRVRWTIWSIFVILITAMAFGLIMYQLSRDEEVSKKITNTYADLAKIPKK